LDENQNRIGDNHRPELKISSINNKTQTTDHIDDTDEFNFVDKERRNDKNRGCIADPFKYIGIHKVKI
jgi:hypothetical protein